MAHQQYLFTLTAVLLGLVVDLGHQWTNSVDHPQAALFGLLKVLRRGPVGREHHPGAGRNLLNGFNGYRSLSFQFGDYVGVMDDLVLHVNGRPVPVKTDLHDLDSAHHTSAKTPGSAENHFQDSASLTVSGPLLTVSPDQV
jgi:hypothetical protein